MSTTVTTRLDPEIFRLPVKRIRDGYYSDAYFVFTKHLLEDEGEHPRVLMQVFQKVDSVLGDLVTRHQNAWKTAYRESPDILRTEVVELLAALRLAGPADDGLAVFPFAARYQPQVTIRAAAEQAAERAEGETE